jgi:hypothetical protein
MHLPGAVEYRDQVVEETWEEAHLKASVKHQPEAAAAETLAVQERVEQENQLDFEVRVSGCWKVEGRSSLRETSLTELSHLLF